LKNSFSFSIKVFPKDVSSNKKTNEGNSEYKNSEVNLQYRFNVVNNKKAFDSFLIPFYKKR
jgi:hypothetical protein